MHMHAREPTGDTIHIPAASFIVFRWSTVGGSNTQRTLAMSTQKAEKKKTVNK